MRRVLLFAIVAIHLRWKARPERLCEHFEIIACQRRVTPLRVQLRGHHRNKRAASLSSIIRSSSKVTFIRLRVGNVYAAVAPVRIAVHCH